MGVIFLDFCEKFIGVRVQEVTSFFLLTSWRFPLPGYLRRGRVLRKRFLRYDSDGPSDFACFAGFWIFVVSMGLGAGFILILSFNSSISLNARA